MHLLEGDELLEWGPTARRWGRVDEESVGPTHGAGVGDVHMDGEGEAGAPGVGDPDEGGVGALAVEGEGEGGGGVGEGVGEGGVAQTVAKCVEDRPGVEPVSPARVAFGGVGSHAHARHGHL